MRKEGKSKLMPILVTLVLLLSVFLTVPQGMSATVLRVQYDRTDLKAWIDTNVSNMTSINDLTPGDEITVRVTDGSLTEDDTYTLAVWNPYDEEYKQLYHGSAKADAKGDVSFETRVPGYSYLGGNVLGAHNLTILDEEDAVVDNVSITIANYYDVRIKANGAYVSYLVHNVSVGDSYDYPVVFEAYNYTGGTSFELADDVDLTFALYEPDGTNLHEGDDVDDGDWDDLDSFSFEYVASDNNLETFYWLNVTNAENATQYTNYTIPIKFEFSEDPEHPLLDEYAWEDEAIKIYGFFEEYELDDDENVLDGDDPTGLIAAVYAPTPNGYVQAGTDDKFSNGLAYISVNPVDNDLSAGTWYFGTYLADGIYRLNESYKAPYIPGFISYYSFEVTTDESAALEIVDPSEILSGFNQTINVSIENDWDDEYYEDMWLHFTGLECWYNGTLYDEDDVVVLGNNATIGKIGGGLGTKTTSSYVYYEFNITFKESGTGKFIATYSENDTIYTDNDGANFELGMLANISGEKTFTVVTPGNINVVIEDAPSEVLVEQTGVWQNFTFANLDYTIINVYGEDEDTPLNATIEITGCGIDETIEEDEAVEDGYWTADGVYQIKLNPKTKGTVTFTITNGTDGYSTTKDYSITGLTGTVTTSVGDDLEITVGTNEKITATITGGDLADVRVSLFDNTWTEVEEIFESEDEEYDGGLFEIEFDEDDDYFDNVGYLVVAAELSERFFYEVIEIVPAHDLFIDIITPTENQTFTVGLETDIVLQVLDGEGGDVVEGIDDEGVIGEILNSEGDVIQTVIFDQSGDEWELDDEVFWFPGTLVITATNNSGADEHDGNLSFDVEKATIHFTPNVLTCGIELEDIDITVTTEDANGNPLPEGTELFINISDGNDLAKTDENSIILDENGAGEFVVENVYDQEGTINMTFDAGYDGCLGNTTNGEITISYPEFTVDLTEIYINEPNVITIWAEDSEGNPLEGINITLYGRPITQPDPALTDEDGMVVFSVQPTASGTVNVTIARDVKYVGGILNWTNAVITDTYITVTARRTMTITVSESPIMEGDTLTVTIKTGTTLVDGVAVTFGGITNPTVAGIATFTAPDPGVESAIYKVKATKAGYYDASEDITVLKKWEITITGPSEKPKTGAKFTVTVIAKGSPLAGGIVTFEGVTATTDGEGKATLTAPSKEGTYTVTATYGEYETGTLPIEVVGGFPGFELVTLIAAIGVAFILLRRRRN